MNRFLSVILLLIPLTVHAADSTPINTLTPKEIADGWILLFDGKTTFGWTSPNDSKWTIVDGMLAPPQGKPGLLVTTTAFQNYELFVTFQTSQVGPYLAVLCDSAGKGSHSFELGSKLARKSIKYDVRGTVERGRITASRIAISGQKQDPEWVSAHIETEPASEGRHIALTGNGIIFYTVKLRPITTK